MSLNFFLYLLPFLHIYLFTASVLCFNCYCFSSRFSSLVFSQPFVIFHFLPFHHHTFLPSASPSFPYSFPFIFIPSLPPSLRQSVIYSLIWSSSCPVIWILSSFNQCFIRHSLLLHFLWYCLHCCFTWCCLWCCCLSCKYFNLYWIFLLN